MAMWAKLKSLPEDKFDNVRRLYGNHLPIEVRDTLCQWIEEKLWFKLDPDNPQHDNYVSSLVASFVQEIQTKAISEENFLLRLKLTEAANNFTQTYNHNPFDLVRIIQHCLQEELKYLQQLENQEDYAMDSSVDTSNDVTQQLDKWRRRTQESEEELKKMQQEQEQFILQYQEFNKRQVTIQQLTTSANGQVNVELLAKLQKEKEMLDCHLRQKAAKLLEMRTMWSGKHQETFTSLSAIQHQVLNDDLICWKRNQQLQGNGAQFINNLEKIQDWCESLAEITWSNRQQLKRVEELCKQLPLNSTSGMNEKLAAFNKQITSALSSLVTSTFIIEKQPPQVMKTNTRFTATVRLLVGSKLNVHMTPPQVKVTIISESQANSLLKTEKISISDSSGDILNNTGTMEYNQGTKQLSINFRNMQLRKIKRAEKKGTESVMDEKFSLLFQSQFKVGGGELVFQVWTLSLPVVVIVHGNQEPHAHATVTWDNAFAEPGRVPFVVPDKVPFARVGEVLSVKFKASVGRGLNEDCLRFLASKSLRNNQLQDNLNALLNWSQFCKEPLPERNFTFWEWFYAINKVTKDHLRGLWNDGSVIGFVGRKQTEDMLLQKPSGTFLLRFSDSELGGVTIAWVDEGQSGPEVLMLQPFTSRDFQIRCLADRINDLKHLVYLYPDTPKDKAFCKYYTPYNENQPNGGSKPPYVKPILVTMIPGLTNAYSLDSCPNTPQSLLQNPHSPSDASLSYHDNPGSVPSNSADHMNFGSNSLTELDQYEFNMDLVNGDMDVPVDFADFMAYDEEKN